MSTAAASADSSKADPHDAGFQRRLGLFDSTMLVIGTMIGSGIFVTSADIAKDVGSAGWLLVVWVLAGVMTIIGALSYSELAAMMPHAGGQYVYLREAYSPMWGFLYGWTCFLVIQTGSIAAVAIAFAKYLGVLVPWLGTDQEIYKLADINIKLFLPSWIMSEPFFEMKHFVISSGQIVAVFIIALLTWLNCRGVQEGKTVQNIFTVAKTAALLGLIALGLTVVSNPQAIAINMGDWWAGIQSTKQFGEVSKKEAVANFGGLVALMVVGGAMVGSLFSADAWNNITFTAGEIKDPRRNVPLSLALGTGTVIILYILANVAYLAVLPVQSQPAYDAVVPQVESLDKRIEQHLALGQKEQAEGLEKEKKAILDKVTAFDRGIAKAKDDRVATAVLEQWSPKLGAGLMAIAIMVSTFGCINGMILMGARLYYAMAVDNLFFKQVGTLNARSVPAVGLVTQGIWSILLVFSGTYGQLLDFVIFAVLVFYVLTVSGLFILRRTQPDAERPYKAVGYPVLPAIYVFLCAVIMLDLLVVKPAYTWPGLIIVLTGIPVYFLWRIFGRGPTPAVAQGLPPTEDEVKLPDSPPDEHIQPPKDQIEGGPG